MSYGSNRISNSEADVLIVGAGPVGLTLAIALATLGIAVRVIDKAPSTKHQPRAGIIWQRTLETLDLLNVAHRLREQANELHALDIYALGRHLGEVTTGHIQSDYPHPIIIEQHNTERILQERLEELGVSVEWDSEAISIDLRNDGATAVVQRPDRTLLIDVPWIVGCEGSDSLVRTAAGITFPGQPRQGLQALQMNASAKWRYQRDSHRGIYFMGDHVSLGCFPLPEPPDAWRFFAYSADDNPQRTSAPTVDEMRDLIAQVAHAPELELTLTEPRWIGRARFQDRIAETFRHSRALLAGDAAHVWAPIAGHGMNTGIRGACNLGWKLAAVIRGESPTSLLDTYSDEQKRTAVTIIKETKLDFVEQLHSRLSLQAISAVAPLAFKSPALQHWMDAMLSDTLLGYRDSPLSMNDGPPKELRAGDRWPQPVADHSAKYRWSVVVPAGSNCTALYNLLGCYNADVRVIEISPSDHPLVSHWIALRPDGYVGCFAQAQNTGIFEKYFDRFLTRK